MKIEKVSDINENESKIKITINGRDMKRRLDRDFLKKVFGDLDALQSDSDEEVLRDLEQMGIDIEKAKARFTETVKKYLIKQATQNDK